MEVIRIYLVVVVAAIVFSLIMPSIAAQAPAPAPAPTATSDGVTIDQGIAYLLMLVALALTYIIH